VEGDKKNVVNYLKFKFLFLPWNMYWHLDFD